MTWVNPRTHISQMWYNPAFLLKDRKQKQENESDTHGTASLECALKLQKQDNLLKGKRESQLPKVVLWPPLHMHFLTQVIFKKGFPRDDSVVKSAHCTVMRSRVKVVSQASSTCCTLSSEEGLLASSLAKNTWGQVTGRDPATKG